MLSVILFGGSYKIRLNYLPTTFIFKTHNFYYCISTNFKIRGLVIYQLSDILTYGVFLYPLVFISSIHVKKKLIFFKNILYKYF